MPPSTVHSEELYSGSPAEVDEAFPVVCPWEADSGERYVHAFGTLVHAVRTRAECCPHAVPCLYIRVTLISLSHIGLLIEHFRPAKRPIR